MGLVVFRHGQNRNHGDRTVRIPLSARSLVHGGKVCIEVTRIAAASWYFLTSSGHLTERFRIVGDICQNDQYVHTQVKCQVFRCGQRHTRRCNTFYCRVVGQVHEHDSSVDGASAPEVRCEEVRFFVGDTDGCKDDGEVAFATDNLGLTGDLRRQFRMGQTGARENRQLRVLLPTYSIRRWPIRQFE